MIGYTPLPSGQSGGITGTLGLNAWSAGAAPFVGALDGYAPFEAWSHRRLLVSDAVTNTVLQVRRMSDDTPLDVEALANGEIDEAGLLSFAGSNSAAVAALKGQIGGVDLAQSIADNQRLIVESGSLVTVGGKAASKGRKYGDNVTNGGSLLTPFTLPGNTVSVFIRGRTDATTGIFDGSLSAPLFIAANNDTISGNGQFVMWFTGASGVSKMSLVGNDAYMVLTQPHVDDFLISIIFDGTTVTVRDGTYTYTYSASASFNVNKLLVGSLTESNQENTAEYVKVQEIALWTSDQTANEAAIRSAMLA